MVDLCHTNESLFVSFKSFFFSPLVHLSNIVEISSWVSLEIQLHIAATSLTDGQTTYPSVDWHIFQIFPSWSVSIRASRFILLGLSGKSSTHHSSQCDRRTDRQTDNLPLSGLTHSSRYSPVGLCPSEHPGSSYWVCQGSLVYITPVSVTDRQTDGQTHNLPISGLTHLPDIPQLVCVHQSIQVHLTGFVREV